MLGLLVIVLVIFLLLGANRLSEVGSGLGQGVRAFKKSMGDGARRKKTRKKQQKRRELDDDEAVWQRRKPMVKVRRKHNDEEGS